MIRSPLRYFIRSGFSNKATTEASLLDELFRQTYTLLNTELLSDESDRLDPHTSSLGIMQSLVESGVLPLNATAFDSQFSRLQGEWFLTMERAITLTPGDSHVMAEIIAFVVDSILTW